jgi:uncharacterized protein
MTNMNAAEPTRTRNFTAIRQMMARFSCGDAAGLLAYLADEVVYESPFYKNFPPQRGRQAMADVLAAVEQRFSSLRYDVVELYGTTDPDLVIAELRSDNQVRNAPRRYQNYYIMFFRFLDGKVVQWREFSNPQAYDDADPEAALNAGP